MKKTTFLIVALFSGIFAFAQVAPDKYYIQFTDKNDSPYSISNPNEFLTQRSLDRRAKYGIEITEQDIPVNPQYLVGVEALGAELFYPTKWLNGVSIYTTDPTVIENINALPYVEGVSLMVSRYDPVKKELFLNDHDEEFKPENLKTTNTANSLDYGSGTNQIEQLNGILLHDDGFLGEGVVIAILDGGFMDVETQPLFDSLWINNQILGTKDFVHPGGNVYTESSHGRKVLSCMGAYTEGQLIGTAPKGSYWLLRSEYVLSENVLEEYNWVSAAEFADSVGADVINSSLGYIDFDMPVWDHDYEDMNGSTAVVTIGADIAESKGILVVNSAGNSGYNEASPWIGAPADGFNVFSIGAVTDTGERAAFSSIGPTADGRTKPDVMAQGEGSAVADGGSGVTFGNGTSFSSPIMAGMSACLMQAFPERTPAEIRAAIKQSGNNSSQPDNYMGWGIPDFMEAFSVMTTIEVNAENEEIVSVYPNPFSNKLTVELNLVETTDAKITIMDINGRLVFSDSFTLKGNKTHVQIGNKINGLNAGIYFLGVSSGDKFEVTRIVKK